MELLIGCGNNRDKVMHRPGREEWSDLVTLDIDPNANPDVVHDLDVLPYPFEADTFDEIHASEVLEHCGRQGDWRYFFGQFAEFWRILKPGGVFCASCPSATSRWAWGDPGHTRLIMPESLLFLSQAEYRQQVGKTAMTDYRHAYAADLVTVFQDDDGESFKFVLEAVK